MKYRQILLLFSFILALSACDKSEVQEIEIPEKYEFTRDGSSSVDYSGQTDRLNQLAAMKTMMALADGGNAIDEQDLLDMFSNAGGDGGGNFSFTSTKQIKDKTSPGEELVLEALMSAMGPASDTGAMGITAANGKAGLLERLGNGSTILVNEKGQEFTQLIEKGIMGATFYYQITAIYLSDDRVGNQVNNEDLVEGKTYTAMEHHWDEAFGYLGVPVDFGSGWPSDRNGEARFLGNYIRGRDALLGCSDILMNAFKKGRNAIVMKAYEVRDEQRDIIYSELEKVLAATAVHYINAALASFSDPGEYHHVLSEAYAFIKALNFSPRATLSQSEIAQLLEDISDENGNLWNATQTGLNAAKDQLSAEFDFETVKDAL